jgi:hypothetical protein
MLPPDTYHFRRVISNVLMLPCAVALLYLLSFRVQPGVLTWVLAFVLGLVISYLVAWLVFLAGYGIVRWLNRRTGGS